MLFIENVIALFRHIVVLLCIEAETNAMNTLFTQTSKRTLK